MNRKLIILVIAACIGWLAVSPQSANAQLRVCGPGETPIGWDNTPIPPVPLCPGGPPVSSAPPPPPSDTHAGFAFHDDASDIWVVGNYTHHEAAQARALTACNQVMGGGCKSSYYINTTLELFRASSGALWFHFSHTGKKARADFMANCRKGQNLPCEAVRKFPANTREYLPGPEARMLYGVAAWPSPDSKAFDNRLWIATGHRIFQSAMDAVVGACQQAHPGKNCVTFSGVGNGFIVAFDRVYRSGKPTDHATARESSAKRATEAAKADCANIKAKCSIEAQFDARKPGLFVHDFKTGVTTAAQ